MVLGWELLGSKSATTSTVRALLQSRLPAARVGHWRLGADHGTTAERGHMTSVFVVFGVLRFPTPRLAASRRVRKTRSGFTSIIITSSKTLLSFSLPASLVQLIIATFRTRSTPGRGFFLLSLSLSSLKHLFILPLTSSLARRHNPLAYQINIGPLDTIATRTCIPSILLVDNISTLQISAYGLNIHFANSSHRNRPV